MTAPHPTTEAVEAAARAWYHNVFAKPAWEDLAAIDQHHYREELLQVLTAVYPQIVADVLSEYAERAYDGTWKDTAWWLEQRAKEVHP